MSPAQAPLPMPSPLSTPAASALDEVRVNAMLAGMQTQRDAALNQVVHLSGELAIQNKNLAMLREEAATLRGKVDDLTATMAQYDLPETAGAVAGAALPQA